MDSDIIYMLMILKFMSPSSAISLDLQTYIFSYLLIISLWMTNRYLKLTTDKTEKLILPHKNIKLDLDSNTDEDTEM